MPDATTIQTAAVSIATLRLNPDQQARRQAFLDRHDANYGGVGRHLTVTPNGETLLPSELSQLRREGPRGLR